MTNKLSDDEVYIDRVVAYVDILGFQSHIDRSTKDPAIARKIRMAIRKFEDFRRADHEGVLSLDVTGTRTSTFSDHIVRSAPLNMPSSVFYTILDVCLFQMEVLALGFLTRGAITTGQLFHDDVVFGPALVEVYKLESQFANYPRVILTAQTIEHGVRNCLDNGPENERDSIMDLLKLSADGLYFVNYLVQSEIVDSDLKYLGWLKQVRAVIVEQLNLPLPQNVKEKYLWLKREYNDQPMMMQGRSTDYGPSAIIIDKAWIIP